jgi:flagellar basal body-associated protein FliL
MGPEELSTLSGKILLEDRLKREINKALNKTVVRSIFFPRYIVQ